MKSTKQVPRKERERLRHRQEILSAAARLFAKKGFHNVSMQEIAAAAEFATGTLYNFFASKEALFEELAENTGRQIMEELAGILEGPGTESERLAGLLRHFPEFKPENVEFVRLFVSVYGQVAAKLQKQDRAKRELYADMLSDKLATLIKVGIRKGLFRPVDPAVTAKAILATMETLAFEIADHFDRAEAADMFAKAERLFLDGLLRPEAPRP